MVDGIPPLSTRPSGNALFCDLVRDQARLIEAEVRTLLNEPISTISLEDAGVRGSLSIMLKCADLLRGIVNDYEIFPRVYKVPIEAPQKNDRMGQFLHQPRDSGYGDGSGE